VRVDPVNIPVQVAKAAEKIGDPIEEIKKSH